MSWVIFSLVRQGREGILGWEGHLQDLKIEGRGLMMTSYTDTYIHTYIPSAYHYLNQILYFSPAVVFIKQVNKQTNKQMRIITNVLLGASMNLLGGAGGGYYEMKSQINCHNHNHYHYYYYYYYHHHHHRHQHYC